MKDKFLENDKLKILFDKQRALMDRYVREKGIIDHFPLDLTEKKDVKAFKECIMDIIQELCEVVEQLKNRPNRKTEIKNYNNDEFKFEIADVLHLFIELCILADIDHKDLFDFYVKKNNINHKRIDSGY